jgi:hypothetical protein
MKYGILFMMLVFSFIANEHNKFTVFDVNFTIIVCTALIISKLEEINKKEE